MCNSAEISVDRFTDMQAYVHKLKTYNETISKKRDHVNNLSFEDSKRTSDRGFIRVICTKLMNDYKRNL